MRAALRLTGRRHRPPPSARTVNTNVHAGAPPATVLLQRPMWYRNTALEPSRLYCVAQALVCSLLDRHE